MTAQANPESDQPDEVEEKLIAALAWYDQAREKGDATASLGTESLDPVITPRFNRLLTVLDELAHLRENSGSHRSDARGGEVSVLRGEPGCSIRRIGRFEIIREIGRGGYGIVFLAFDPTLRREVALKVPRPELVMSVSARKRFVREGYATAALSHPNLVTVFEIGEVEPVCYVAQEYCAGPNLDEWIRDQAQRVSPRVAAQVVARLAEGIDHAHRRGVIHRDLKPGNVLMQRRSSTVEEGRPIVALDAGDLDWIPRIVDFGLARLTEGDAALTATGAMVGTPAYMAPEQLEPARGAIGPSCDIYALGCILFQMLTREAPFVGTTHAELLKQVLIDPPRTLRSLRPELPADLEAICARCLEKDPARRYASASLLADDLHRYLRGEPTLVRPLTSIERVLKWTRRKPWIAALIAVSSLALITIMAVLTFSYVELSRAYLQVVEHEKSARQSAHQARQRAYASDLRLLDDTWTTFTPQHANALLDEYRPEAGETDLRGFDWWFYWHKINKETPSRVIGQHAGGVDAAAMSPAGDIAATGGTDGVIRLWNMPAGSPLRELRGHRADVNCLAFSPDGKLLASAGEDQTVRVWNVMQGESIQVLKGHTDWVATVLFLPDGKRVVSGAADRVIVVWNAESGEELARLVGHTDTVRSLAHQIPLNLLFSSSEDATIRVWDLDRMAPSDRLPPEGLDNPLAPRWVRQLALEPNQLGLDGVYFGEAVITWNLEPNRIGRVHSQHATEAATRCHQFCGHPDDPVMIVGLANGSVLRSKPGYLHKQLDRLLGHNHSVEAVTGTPDGKTLVSGSIDGEVRIWPDISQGHFIRRVPWPFRDAQLAISPSSTLVAINDAESLHVLGFNNLKTLYNFPLSEEHPVALAFGPREQSVAALGDEGIQFCHLDGSSWSLPLDTTLRPSGLVLDQSANIMAVFGQNDVVLVDLAEKQIVAHLRHPMPVGGVAFRTPYEIITSCADGLVRVWDRRTPAVSRICSPQVGALSEVSLAPAGRQLAVRGYQQVAIVDLDTCQVVTTLPQYTETGSMAFVAGGQTLLTQNRSSANRLWNATNWQPTGQLIEMEMFRQFVVAADGYRLAAISAEELILIDASPSEE